MTSPESDQDVGALRDRLVQSALPHAAFDGWTVQTLRQATRDAGLTELDAYRAFPAGADDLLQHHLDCADRDMVSAMLDLDLDNMRIRDKIASGVRLRLEQAGSHKEAVRRGLNHLGLPHRAPRAMKALFRTVDLMWRTIGDTSTDYNFYTKRALLSGVYGSTLLFWLNDQSEDHEQTWAFLDRRISNVMQIEKAKAKLIGSGAHLPDPMRILDRLSRRSRRAFRA
jgi:ubiquinone biosynthesis protein COQ9